jgi:hypothetical protein
MRSKHAHQERSNQGKDVNRTRLELTMTRHRGTSKKSGEFHIVNAFLSNSGRANPLVTLVHVFGHPLLWQGSPKLLEKTVAQAVKKWYF